MCVCVCVCVCVVVVVVVLVFDFLAKQRGYSVGFNNKSTPTAFNLDLVQDTVANAI